MLARSLIAITLFAAAACTGNPAPRPPTAATPPASEASVARAVRWNRTSAERRAVYLQTYALATEKLRRLAAGREPGSWAVALDGDETVIDNSLYEKELELAGDVWSEENWAAWIERLEAPPLPGALAFLREVHELGGKIAIVTNRRDIHCALTEKNFDRYGIPYDVILCRPGEEREKEDRWRQIQQGTASPGLPPLEILMWLGDDIGDFPHLDQEIRRAEAGAFSEFGDRYFVFPNPAYGSWRDNPFE